MLAPWAFDFSNLEKDVMMGAAIMTVRESRYMEKEGKKILSIASSMKMNYHKMVMGGSPPCDR